MFRRFARDVRGNYAAMLAVATVPIMGGLALAVDYSEMSRQRQETLNALDAAGIATARRVIEGASEAQLKAYAKDFFEANLASVRPENTQLDIVLPQNNTGGGTLKLTAGLKYEPYFFPAFLALLGGGGDGVTKIDFRAESEVRLKNTLEVALVLDNSGSMDFTGTGSGKKRLVLLKEAAKQLVDTIADQAAQMKQVQKPVQFGLVPFSSAVNIGTDKAGAGWMDQDGISPIHHENFDWSTFSASNKKVQKIGGVYYKKGSAWGAEENQKVTRFTLFDELKRVTGTQNTTCKTWNSRRTSCLEWNTTPVYGPFASWQGCVEARPFPYNVNDAPANSTTPATMFVPMFAPDETDLTSSSRPANNNWWPDGIGGSGNSLARQENMVKYFTPQNTGAMGLNEGPNASCSTKPITPLTDVSNTAGRTVIKNAIDAMEALGATNVPEGMAWGWRVVSGGAPFTEGRPDSERGNDKVVIVLTDGANTYYTPDSVTANEYSGSGYRNGGNDLAGNKAIYSAFGYAKRIDGVDSRLFQGTSSAVSKSDYSNGNYTKAMNEHFAKLCDNAKANKLIVMTVSLDLNASDATEKAQMDALKACASESRFRKDPSNPTKPDKNYWNTTGGDLAETFKKIADELSNLRIVG